MADTLSTIGQMVGADIKDLRNTKLSTENLLEEILKIDGPNSGIDAATVSGVGIDDLATKTTWATSTVGGVVKMRVDEDTGTVYLTNDGTDA